MAVKFMIEAYSYSYKLLPPVLTSGYPTRLLCSRKFLLDPVFWERSPKRNTTAVIINEGK
jgi:hypothetical protein